MQAPPELTGRVFGGQFRLERLLGRGGMGEVYLAEQLELGRHVVVKLLHSAQLARPDAEERFKREARALAQLNHPNVVHLYAFGRTEEGSAYLAMEYVEGRTLASVVAAAGALPEPLVREILDQLCSALEAAHQRGIIHRDLKPDNVMLVERAGQPVHVKVLDFGVARLMRDPTQRLTRSGELLGTPMYMAPEQLSNQAVDERADIYGLGVIAYELATGAVPFEAETTMALLSQVATAQAVPPRRRAPERGLSPGLDLAIMRCLQKDPAHRFQSASELRAALSREPGQVDLPPSAADDAALSLGVFESQKLSTVRRVRRPSPFGSLKTGLAVALGLVSAFAVTTLGLRLREQHVEQRSDPSAPLALHEWVQGLPFPIGTRYLKFDANVIDARIPARPEVVLAFYRGHLATRWGASRELPHELVFDEPRALIKRLSATAVAEGTQLVIIRRPRE